MQINQIHVSAGRTFNHPYEQYANFRHHVELQAVLADGEDAAKAVQELQAKAEKLAEDHKTTLLASIEELRELTSLEAEMRNLESSITKGQERLEEIRKRKFERPQLPISTQASDSMF